MNLRDALAELGVPFAEGGTHRHVHHGWMGVDCPQCSPGSGKFKLGINPRTFATTCWSCGRMRVGAALAAVSGRSLSDILKLLPQLSREETGHVTARPRGRFTPPIGVGPLLEPHKRYLVARGFDPDETTARWGIAGLGPLCALKWRLYIPVTMDGRDVSWTTRAVGNSTLRYRAADPADESVPIHDTLYGWDYVRHTAIVCEGPTDVWAIGKGAVCTFGLNVSDVQIALLSSIPRRVVCFDNESNAQRRAQQLADELAVHAGETYVVRLSGDDPASSPPDEIAELRAQFLDSL